MSKLKGLFAKKQDDNKLYHDDEYFNVAIDFSNNSVQDKETYVINDEQKEVTVTKKEETVKNNKRIETINWEELKEVDVEIYNALFVIEKYLKAGKYYRKKAWEEDTPVIVQNRISIKDYHEGIPFMDIEINEIDDVFENNNDNEQEKVDSLIYRPWVPQDIHYEPMDEFDVSFYLDILLDGKTTIAKQETVKKEEICFINYESIDDFDISFYLERLLEGKTIIPIIEEEKMKIVEKDVIHYERMAAFDISFYLNILLENKQIIPINEAEKENDIRIINVIDEAPQYKKKENAEAYINVDVNLDALKPFEENIIHYEKMAAFDISFYLNILLENKQIIQIIEEERHNIFGHEKVEAQAVVEEKQNVEVQEEQLQETNFIAREEVISASAEEQVQEVSTISEKNIVEDELAQEEIVCEEAKQDIEAENEHVQEEFVEEKQNAETQEEQFQKPNNFVSASSSANELLQEDNYEDEFDRLIDEYQEYNEDDEHESILDILAEIERNSANIIFTQEERTKKGIDDYVTCYKALTERKVRSIYENIIMMIQSIQPCAYATLVHVVEFESLQNQLKYAKALSGDNVVKMEHNEVLVTITVEVEEEHLCSHILDFALEANIFEGVYKGWKVTSVF